MLLAAVLWLYFLDWNTMRGPLVRYASHRLGREVRIEGNLDVHIFSFTPRVSIFGLKLVNPPWVGSPLAADVAHLTVSFRLLPLLFGDLIIPNLELDSPNILYVRDAQGHSNWDFDKLRDRRNRSRARRFSDEGWNLPPIYRFVVQNGHLAVDDRRRKLLFVGTISAQEQANGGDSAFRLIGRGTLNKSNFLADIRGGPLIHVDESKPYRFAADLHSGATHVVGNGAILRPFHLGHFWATTTFSGPNLADLYYLTGLAFPGTPPYRLSGTLTRDGSVYRFANFAGVVGESDLRGDLSVESAPDPSFVTATLTSHQLNFADLGPLIGAPSAESGASVTAQTAHVLPDALLHIERIRQMDADVQYEAETIKSRDFPLRGLRVHIVLDKGTMTLDPIEFEFSRGKLAGSLKIDARNDVPVTDMDVRLSNVRVEQFVAEKSPPVEGTLEARVVLHGVGSSVHKAASTANGAITAVIPSGSFRRSFAELTGIDVLNGLGLLLTNDKSNTGLRCAVAHFDVRAGVLHAEPFVVDTDKVLIQGKGAIDLRSETLDLSVVGKPKEFRIGRVRAPLVIRGAFSHPTIGVSAGSSLAQGGIAVILGGVLNPLVALLAFVDPGLTKDANCLALSAQAARGPASVISPHRLGWGNRARR